LTIVLAAAALTVKPIIISQAGSPSTRQKITLCAGDEADNLQLAIVPAMQCFY
jgi:hypothetical protein